ncbi:MAG: MBL fold metallo-hydrolase, partial [Hyphomicrobiales bacterium]|nr:MBL fold metallo-hydrolase [Hyphomicrobiales bacterium]
MRALFPLFLLLAVLTGTAAAEGLKVESITDGVYAIVGPLEQRSPENLGNNATFGLVVTEDGAVLIDSGGSYKGAAEIAAAIGTVTDQPVRIVINTGGQDHRWLGNGYFRERGARIVASVRAVADQKDRQSQQFTMLEMLIGKERLAGTEPVYAEETFEGTGEFGFGGLTFQLANTAPAHTPGDTHVWVPEKSTVFTGDIVYVDRLLGVLDHSDSAGWVKAFEAIAALSPTHIVPGHGGATDLATATAETYDYLVNLRAVMRAHIDAGGDIIGSVDVDQSAFASIGLFDQLARRNAQAVFQEMEFE